VARGSGLDDRLADEHRQNRRPGKKAEETHVDRGIGEGCARAALPQATETVSTGDHLARGLTTVRERSRPGVVLQSATEGKEDDAAEYARRWHYGGHAARSSGSGRSASRLSSAGSPARFAHGSQPQSADAQSSGSYGSFACGSLAFAGASPVGPRGNLAELGKCVVDDGNDDLAAVLSSLPSGAHR